MQKMSHLISAMCFAAIILLNINAYAIPHIESINKRNSLAGEWKIKHDDNSNYALPGYNDSKWATIKMPSNITKYVRAQSNSINGIFWLRKTIVINKNIKKETIGIILGTIGNADETYFNGVKIGALGQFPPQEKSMWHHYRHYVIPESIINYGDRNIISIRISYFGFAEMLGTLAITNLKDWQDHKRTTNFVLITSNYLIIAMGFLLVILFLVFYIRRPKSSEYLFYCLQLFFGFWIVFDVCNYWDSFSGSSFARLITLMVSWVALNVAHPIFLHRIYNLKRKKTETFLWSYLSIVVILGIIFIFTNIISLLVAFNIIAPLIISITNFVGVYNLSCHISALYKKKPFSKLFSSFGITVILGAIHDGIAQFIRYTGNEINIFGYTFQYILFPLSALFLYIGTAFVFVHRFISTTDEVSYLNTNLEKKVEDSTVELLSANEEIEATMEELQALNENLTTINNDLEESKRTHDRDLRLAANAQSSILPKSDIESDTFDIALVYKPAFCVSGDLYDFYKTNNNITGVGLFDVSGHGISSGLITLMAKSIIYRHFVNNSDMKLNEMLKQINKNLINEIGETDSYLTGILLRFKNEKIEYVNSGHPDLKFKSTKNNMTTPILDSKGQSICGPFLGIDIMEKPFKTLSFTIEKGDCLFLHSDCLNESENPKGESFDDEKILEQLKNAPDSTAQEMLNYIMDEFYNFIQDKSKIKDDLTAILIKMK